MQNGFSKGLKPLFVRRLALLMGICYLLNPFQKQISIVFHEVSHALVIPDYIMSHDSNTSYAYEAHGHKDQQIDFIDHDHELIDFVDSVLAGSEENDSSGDSLLHEVKIDKHITTYHFNFQKCFNSDNNQEFWWTTKKLRLAYLKRLVEPPQHS